MQAFVVDHFVNETMLTLSGILPTQPSAALWNVVASIALA